MLIAQWRDLSAGSVLFLKFQELCTDIYNAKMWKSIRTYWSTKKTDSEANTHKKNYWIKVANEFNALFSSTARTSEVLIHKYRNLKKRCKRNFANENCYSQGTDGGPLKTTPVTDIDVTIKGMLGAQVLGDNSEFDYDQISIVPHITESIRMPLCNYNKSKFGIFNVTIIIILQ
ncbi:hypothetical protein FQA39_LY03829 [Lamprigera yunnana]|nr:hypothetical protein FQA39_LY03829 [Lamprigera yunnana]